MPEPTPERRKAAATRPALSTVPRGIVLTDEPGADSSKRRKHVASSVSVSFAVHAIILLILSWIYFDLPNRDVLESIMVLMGAGDESRADVEFELPAEPQPAVDMAEAALFKDALVREDELPVVSPETIDPEVMPGADSGQPTSTTGPAVKAPPNKPAARSKAVAIARSSAKKEAVAEPEVVQTNHFEGRTPKGKAALLKRMGGTDASEAAVARGLVWLKNHQLPDGSWNFYHLVNPRCDCTMPGRLANNPNAATAMALLAFLGAGNTHQSGDYQPEVQKGLEFLVANGTTAEKGICYYGDLTGPPTFYTHGLVTICLSEALAMTGDAQLRPSVVGAVDFLAATQELGGGWRYFPGQPGDTSVVAWQLMGLKSAQFSRINVPQKVFIGVDRFMSSVASVRGSQYAYTADRKLLPTPSMTAAGLLCRMYLGWKEDHPSLRAGIRHLDQMGPNPDSMYYNYYATQVLHHWGGPEWEKWNNVMRDYLVKMQIQEGHATGSWDVADPHGNLGGRLYMTTLALLTLEVYYRHLPLYQKDRIEIPLLNAAEAKAP